MINAELTGKSFRLKQESAAIELESGVWTVVRLVSDSVVKVMRHIVPRDMVLVCWEGHSLLMLTKDIEQRSEEIPGELP